MNNKFLLLCAVISLNSSVALRAFDDNMISHLIVAQFLKERKKHVASWSYSFKDATLEAKVFGSVKLHDVDIVVKREECDDNLSVIIVTDVLGSPEEFSGENILENETKILKNILIKSYLDELERVDPATQRSIVIDKQTKVIWRPEFLMVTMKNGFLQETQSYSKNRMGMRFVTILSMDEFNDLVSKYFLDNAPVVKEAAVQAKTGFLGLW